MPDARAEALRRLRADAIASLGDRVRTVAAEWEQLRTSSGWDEEARERVRRVAAVAHKLAGGGGTFGFPEISRAAASLEVILGGLAAATTPTPESLDQATQLVDALLAAWQLGPTEPTWGGAPETSADDEDGRGEGVVLAVTTADRLDDLVGTIAGLGFSAMPQMAGDDQVGQPVPGAIAAVLEEVGDGALRWASGLVGRIPVVMITDNVDLPARLRAARAGVDVVMGRPVDGAELADWLNSFVVTGTEQPYSVLIVDDDRLLLETYAASLERAGIVVGTTSDPAAAPGMITASFPDLVLMDVQMPEINGIELARVIRQSRRFLSLPIVFLSAEQDRERQLQARRFGGDDFIAKPVDLDRLVSLVRLRAERARALRTAMEQDSLTGLLNHGRFKDRLQHELERSRRTGAELSLAIIDIDRFKAINDTYGHFVGDQILRNLARTLKGRLRRTELIGRYGGEEFGVILLDTVPRDAQRVVDAVREVFSGQTFEANGAEFNVTFSAGVASNRSFPDMKGLIEAADAALYAAKRGGRNRVGWTAPPL